MQLCGRRAGRETLPRHWRGAAPRTSCGRRGWLRAFAVSAAQISAMFTSLVHRDAPDAAGIWPAPAPGVTAQALSALAAYAEGLRRRFEAVGTVAWVQAGIAACGGWLFCVSWWAGRSQHEHALTGGPRPRQVGPERLP